MSKKGLGKGLSSLFDDGFSDEFNSLPDFDTNHDSDEEKDAVEININLIEPNSDQPRKSFDKEKLEELAKSIKEHGLIQPIIVTQSDNGMYKIVAGERRWRAAKLTDIKKLPAIVRKYTKEQVAQIALIENLQREDLNPIEEATGYRTLMDEYGMTQEDVGQTIGKSRSAVANSLRLLALEEGIQSYLISGDISGGHARALLSLPDTRQREELLEIILAEGLNVRQAEAMAKKLLKEKKQPEKKEPTAYDIQLEEIQSQLSSSFGTKVKITNGRKKGKIEIEYYGSDDLERILNMLQ